MQIIGLKIFTYLLSFFNNVSRIQSILKFKSYAINIFFPLLLMNKVSVIISKIIYCFICRITKKKKSSSFHNNKKPKKKNIFLISFVRSGHL